MVGGAGARRFVRAPERRALGRIVAYPAGFYSSGFRHIQQGDRSRHADARAGSVCAEARTAQIFANKICHHAGHSSACQEDGAGPCDREEAQANFATGAPNP